MKRCGASDCFVLFILARNNPVKKFNLARMLDCLSWNDDPPPTNNNNGLQGAVLSETAV